MKLKNIIISTLFALLITTNAFAVTVSKSFTAVGAGLVLAVDNQDRFTYAVSGTFVGTVELQKSLNNGASYQVVRSITGAATGEVTVDTPSGQAAIYRFYCRAFTSGTIVTSMVDVNSAVQEFKNRKGEIIMQVRDSGVKIFGDTDIVGDVNAVPAAEAGAIATVSIQQQLKAAKKIRITLTDVPVTVTSITSGAGVGGVKLMDLPIGWINRLGCVSSLTVSVATAKQADFTDATPEGQLGVGTLAPADADALGADSTDDDFSTATDFTMTAYNSGAVALPVEAAGIHDGSATAVPVFANVYVDAADIDDGVVTEVLLNGTIDLTYAELGDN